MAPNRLVVDEAAHDDNSCIALNPKKMSELQLFRGDTVEITGNGKTTVCIVLSDDSHDACHEGSIRINKAPAYL